ncbi:hypothetical protein ACLOJK_029684 [Asimina triloba]
MATSNHSSVAAPHEQTRTNLSFHLLTSEGRDFLISPSENQTKEVDALRNVLAPHILTIAPVKVNELQGKTVGLYFSANWYPHCQNFTPLLASVYNQLKEKDAEFEIVFVSSDEDQNSFVKFHSTMPWLAIPFSDLQSKKGLTQRFQIEGIPSLVVLDPQGNLIQMDGVDLIYRYGVQAFPFTPERIAELQAEEKANHESQTLEKLLATDCRDYVVLDNGKVPISDLLGKTVGLYFSAQWCPPCKKFTPRLVAVYNNLKEKKEDFEIIFISIDRDEEGYLDCCKSMPWPALPYGDKTVKVLSKYFNIQGIPSLVIIGPDGKTVTKEGRNLINLHLEMAYPFTEAQLLLLQEKQDEEAKRYPKSFHHVGHRHVLNLVSAASGGGPFICCECDEQGSGWAYQCIECGYEVHLKCAQEVDSENPEMEKNHRDWLNVATLGGKLMGFINHQTPFTAKIRSLVTFPKQVFRVYVCLLGKTVSGKTIFPFSAVGDNVGTEMAQSVTMLVSAKRKTEPYFPEAQALHLVETFL